MNIPGKLGVNFYHVEKGDNVVRKFAKSISLHLSEIIESSDIITLIKESFHDWNENAIHKLVAIAHSCG